MSMNMKKIISAVLSVLFSAVLASGALAVGHTSADQVFGADGTTDLASVGNNDITGTSLGTITDDKLTLWGWYADEQKITEFGYRYGDNVTLGSAKYTGGGDDAVIAEQAGKLGYTDGESVRFRIENIPVVKGDNVELYAVAKLADGSTIDIWKLTYTSASGIAMPGTAESEGSVTEDTAQDTTGNTTGNTTQNTPNPKTADTTVISIAAAGCLALAGVMIIKKIK